MKYNMEDLYWADWDKIGENPNEYKIIFDYIENSSSFSLEELSGVLKLYNNPHGAYTIEFAKIISEIYIRDKIKFIKALNLVKDEIPNLVYAFRMEKVFQDEDIELNQIFSLNKLSQEEIHTANFFFKMYKTICSS